MKKQEPITKEQIEQWKARYGRVTTIEVGDAVAYFRSPSRQIMDHASMEAMEGKKIKGFKFNEVILKDCFLGGDKRILDEDEYFLAACDQVEELMTKKKASSKQL